MRVVGGNGPAAAAAATRHLDYSEINNLVKSQDRAGAREGAPGETSTTTRAEKKRKPDAKARHQMPWRFRLVERQRGYIFFRFDQHQDSGTARRTGSKEKELPTD